MLAVSRGKLDEDGRLRLGARYRGDLIFAKPAEAQRTLARRIGDLQVDVLGIQEVESIEALEDFVSDFGLRRAGFRHLALVEGNDDRLIDVALNLEASAGRGHLVARHRTHPDAPDRPIFSRDLLQAEILDPDRRRVFLTVYVNHLKSQLGGDESGRRRTRQAEAIAQVLFDHPAGGPYVVLGDINDAPESEPLASLPGTGLVNASRAHGEADVLPLRRSHASRQAALDPPIPRRGTDRLWRYDHARVSPDLRDRVVDAWILRRTTRGGDASDHDPAAVELRLE